MSNFVFVLGKTTGFDKNWGYVKKVGSSSHDAHYLLQRDMYPSDTMFTVDGEKFTLEQAEEIATEKAEEIYGKPSIDFDAVKETHNAK